MEQYFRKITKREFLKTAAFGIAVGLMGRSSFSFDKEQYDLVVISGDPVGATKKALEAMGGISRFVKKGQKVVLKPNMSFARTPEFSATTHPLVVATVAQACREAGAQQVLVLDHTLHRAELCLERTGIQEACKNISGVHVLAIQERKFYQEVKIPRDEGFRKRRSHQRGVGGPCVNKSSRGQIPLCNRGEHGD